MPVTISGSTGIQNVLGSASAPAESNTTSSNTGLYFPTSTTLGLSTAGTNALYVDASQNVGIGTTSPIGVTGTKLDVRGSITAGASSAGRASLEQGSSTNSGYVAFWNSDLTVRQGYVGYATLAGGGQLNLVTDTANAIAFNVNGTERARIDTSGNLLVGTTSQIQSGKISFVGTCSGQSSTASFSANQTGTSGDQFYFRTSSGATLAGYITCPTASTTSYVSVSDYRLKENVIPINNGLTTISALKPVKYDWLTDKAQGEGFIAHELAEFIPMAVTGEKDAVDADGKPQYQGVDYSKIVVHLVAALQELKAEFDAYKTSHP
jgi:hypothetical protein